MDRCQDVEEEDNDAGTRKKGRCENRCQVDGLIVDRSEDLEEEVVLDVEDDAQDR